jgi:hypothetical protein
MLPEVPDEAADHGPDGGTSDVSEHEPTSLVFSPQRPANGYLVRAKRKSAFQ